MAQTTDVASDEGSDEATDCHATTCSPGYYLAGSESAQVCSICPADSFCIGNTSNAQPCPGPDGSVGEHAIVSPAGSDAAEDCYPSECKAGWGQYDATTPGWQAICGASVVGGCCLACDTNHGDHANFEHMFSQHNNLCMGWFVKCEGELQKVIS